MDHAGRVEAVAHELDGLLAALEAGPLAVPVPTCPGWSARDLASHAGWFCLAWRDHLRGGSYADRVHPDDVTAPDGDGATLDRLREVSGELLGELRAAPADAPVWTWHPTDRTAGFVARRCAHELAIHRYDAQSARGTCKPIAPDLAADGICEVLDTLWRPRYQRGVAGGQTLHLHGTEGVEWLVRLDRDELIVTHEHAKADLALRGTVSDLELLLYARPPLGDLEHLGNPAILDLWHHLFRF